MYKRLTVSLLALTVLLVSVLAGIMPAENEIDPDIRENLPDSSDSRSHGTPRTQFLPDLTEYFMVPYRDNLVQKEQGYVKLDDKVISQMSSLTASDQSTYQRSTSRIAQAYKGILHVCFISEDGSGGIEFNMMTFDELGTPLDGPVVVGRRTGTTDGSLDMRIHQDKIFLLIATGGGGTQELRVKVCHYLDWKNLSGIQGQRLQSNFDIQQTSIVEFQDSIMVFWRRAGIYRPYYRVYDNGSWSDTMNIATNMERIAPAFSRMNGIDTVYLYYIPFNARDEIHVMNTTNFGQTWSGSSIVKTFAQEMEHISLVPAKDKVHVAVSFDQLNKIRYFTHSHEGIDDETDIADYVPNVQDGDPREISISCAGADIFIMYEETGGRVTLKTIRDGPYPIESVSFGNGMAHSPALGCEMSAICFINGTNLEIRTMGEAGSGMMYLYPVSPVGLGSWDRVGFNTGGLSDTASISFRILDWEDGSQLFPVAGYHDIGSSGPGIIEPYTYTNLVDLTGEWTSGETIVPAIIMEVQLQRQRETGEDPWLMDVCIDFSNSFPYRDDLTEDLHVAASMNCDVTPIGIKMIEGADDAWAIIGPVEIEGTRPAHLSVLGGFLGGENMIRAEVLDPNWEVVPGFGSESSTVITTEDQQEYIKWGDLNLHDLPPMLDTFYLRVEMEKVNSVEPAVKWVEFSGSTEPSIMGSLASRSSIYRGERSIITIEALDGEEPPEDLMVVIEYMHSDSGLWENTLVSEGLWTGDFWEFGFFTDMDTEKGDYTFRSRVTDGVGLTTDWTELDLEITVKNNIPKPPKIGVDPPAARVGDVIEAFTIFEGSDPEVEKGDLTYRIDLYRDGAYLRTHENLSTPDLVLQDIELVKHENWTLEVMTWDGEDISPSFFTWFMVENTEPVTTDQLPSIIEMDEDAPLTIEDPSGWLFDADGDELDITYTSGPGLDLSFEGEAVTLIPGTDINGDSNIKVDFTDGEVEGSVNIPVIIRPENDAPIHNTIQQVRVEQGKWVYIDLGAEDLRDNETLDIDYDILSVIPDLEVGRNLFMYPNGSLRLKASNEMVGTHNVTCNINDGASPITVYIEIVVIDVNDIPSIDYAHTDDLDSVFLFGEGITLKAEANDIDEVWGDTLSYTWSSDKDGELGDGKELPVTLSIGVHTITLMVSDGRGGYNSTQFDLTVVAPEEEAGTVMRSSTLFLISGSAAFIVGLLIAIIIIVISVVRRKKDDKKKDEEKEPMEGPSELKGSETPKLSTGTSEERQLPPATSMPENVVPRLDEKKPDIVQEPKLEEPVPKPEEDVGKDPSAGVSPPEQGEGVPEVKDQSVPSTEPPAAVQSSQVEQQVEPPEQKAAVQEPPAPEPVPVPVPENAAADQPQTKEQVKEVMQ